MGRLVKPCSWPGCPSYAVRGGRCSEHNRTVAREVGSAHKRGYNDARWLRLRKMVLARDPLCPPCLREGVYRASTDVDHVVPRDQGGLDTLDNLQGLCSQHHGKKTRAENNPRLHG